MKRIILFASCAFIALSPIPAQTHPHVFVDAGLHFLFDDKGQLAAVRVIWVYDELYSLLLVEDRGLDQDGDDKLTEAEKQALAGTDVDWDQGFPGDLELSDAAGEPILLASPVKHMADYKDGRIITSHIRPLKNRFRPGANGINAKIFDPTYFVAYDLRLSPKIEGDAGCKVEINRVDIRAAMEKVDKEYFGPGAKEFSADDYPEVGELFADTMVLTCAPSS
ncbi:MAG TPA: DUF1007 domain-containing protein [Rhodobacteraceae bacterium]|jgi:ABC-type uncharacterized transport system substrate-binding protein|nr:DUF1007 domain-containing protein [Paracoccaceae bacterium]